VSQAYGASTLSRPRSKTVRRRCRAAYKELSDVTRAFATSQCSRHAAIDPRMRQQRAAPSMSPHRLPVQRAIAKKSRTPASIFRHRSLTASRRPRGRIDVGTAPQGIRHSRHHRSRHSVPPRPSANRSSNRPPAGELCCSDKPHSGCRNHACSRKRENMGRSSYSANSGEGSSGRFEPLEICTARSCFSASERVRKCREGGAFQSWIYHFVR